MVPRKKKQPTEEENIVRFNVSVQPIVLKWAKEVMRARGFATISVFVADLIRRAKEKEEEREKHDLCLNEGVSPRGSEAPTVATQYK